MFRTILVLLIALAAANPSRAAKLWMTDVELRTAFAGQNIEGHYSDGRTFTETYKRDRRLEYVEGRRTQLGYWEIVAGTFCTIYDGIANGGCFRVHQVSVNCFEFYFQARDQETAADRDRRGRPSWTARAWRTDSVSTCRERPSV